MAKEIKGIVNKVANDIVESTKNQHQISKARHTYAKKSPAEKQKIELAELEAKNNLNK